MSSSDKLRRDSGRVTLSLEKHQGHVKVPDGPGEVVLGYM